MRQIILTAIGFSARRKRARRESVHEVHDGSLANLQDSRQFKCAEYISLFIKLYQYLISPLMKPCCRYYPSCSQYALGVIEQYGVFKGLWMASKRLLRCHPWSRGGYDPVLPNDEKY